MKKIKIIITILVMLLTCGMFSSCTEKDMDLEITKKIKQLDVNNRVIINELEKTSPLTEIKDQTQDNIIFEYINLNELALNKQEEILIARIYYYKNDVFNSDVLTIYPNTKLDIKKEIINFCEDRFDFIKKEETKENKLFTPVLSSYQKTIFKPYGYMENSFTTKKYRPNDDTTLYLVEATSEFTPGRGVNASEKTKYNDNTMTKSGFVHVNAKRYVKTNNKNQKLYGGLTCIKDTWPQTSNGTTEIRSTFSPNLCFGYSYLNGFSLKYSQLPGVVGIGDQIDYAYSKPYTKNFPKLSNQHDPEDYNKYQWSFICNDENSTQSRFTLNTGYMFEMNNTGHDFLGEGQFTLEFNLRMQVITNGKLNTFNNTFVINWE